MYGFDWLIDWLTDWLIYEKVIKKEPIEDCNSFQQEYKVACLLQGNIFVYIQLGIHKTVVVLCGNHNIFFCMARSIIVNIQNKSKKKSNYVQSILCFVRSKRLFLIDFLKNKLLSVLKEQNIKHVRYLIVHILILLRFLSVSNTCFLIR